MSAVPVDDSIDEREIDQALEEAHIPSLMAALVHLTGNSSHINDENKPVYDFFGDGQGNIKPDVQAQIRAAVKRVLRKRGVREADFEPFIARFIQQAEAQYADWPLVA